MTECREKMKIYKINIWNEYVRIVIILNMILINCKIVVSAKEAYYYAYYYAQLPPRTICREYRYTVV